MELGRGEPAHVPILADGGPGLKPFPQVRRSATVRALEFGVILNQPTPDAPIAPDAPPVVAPALRDRATQPLETLP